MSKTKPLAIPKRRLLRLSATAVDWIVLSLIAGILVLQAFGKH